MIHILSQLDPMVWLMMVVVAVGFLVSALVLVELLGSDTQETQAPPPAADAESPDAHARPPASSA